MKTRLTRYVPMAVMVLVLSGPSGPAMSQDLAAFEQNVTEFTLDNGLTFIVVENHDAPVLSVLTYADVGSADEVKGITGIAHLFEHMAFKGTTTIGAMDLEAEYAAMEKVDEIFDDLRNERHKGHLADPERLASLEQAFEDAKTAARELGRSNAMDEAIDRAGGTGLNASTSRDATRYYYNLPSNKL
ncbi:MAG: insulinase family protein [Gemmatimonadetes bacterium]|nr:insulinase family protein [Gemmatimonadota bacterium]